jgi:oxalate decarboxylase
MTVFASEGHANTVDTSAGNVAYVPRSMGHYVENTGTTTLRFLELFASSYYADISLTNWMANTPHELVAAHLHLDESMLRALAATKQPIVPA